MKLIDGDRLKKEIHENDIMGGLNYAWYIDHAELVDAVEVVHGEWIKLDMHAHLADHKCTACGQECYVPTCMGEPMYTYCPNCGAKMDGERREDDA